MTTCHTGDGALERRPASTRGDHLRFLRSWAARPLRTAAIAPSGRALAHLMTHQINPSTAPVIELGPGTGVFTRALLRRGLSGAQLTLVESNPEFATLLRARFRDARVVHSDATTDDWHLPPGVRAGAVVSGLPLLAMPADAVSSVLQTSFSCLRPDGHFYQFTYSWACPVPASLLHTLGLRATRVGRTLRNLPPASVYRFDRHPGLPLTGGH